jgi:N-acyl-L-homoserine lactone synthetase
MGVRIKMASTAEELDELFQVRHRVFVREKRYFLPVADGRLLDRYDAFPTTANIVALHEGHVVGGVRIVEPSGCGTPADAFFDFDPHLPLGASVGSGSMLVMEEQFRKVPRVTFAMLGMMYYWALCKGLTHITGVAAPDAEPLFLGSGYRPVRPRFFHEATQLWALPVILDIVELNDRFSAFVDRHQFQHFLRSFERQFHQAGEPIILRGEEGTCAYVIIEGRVSVSVGGDRQTPATGIAVREMGPGEVFGELALITSRPRSADVTALTDVDLMVLERAAFYRQIAENPEVALNLLGMLGNRLMSLTDRLGGAAPAPARDASSAG